MFYVERGLQFRTNTALSISLSLRQRCVHIRSFSGPYFSSFGLNTAKYGVSLTLYLRYLYSVRMRENTEQKNSECGHFSHSVSLRMSSKEQERNISR